MASTYRWLLLGCLLWLIAPGSWTLLAETAPERTDRSINRGLRYLELTQLEDDREIMPGVWDWVGDWPQVAYLDTVPEIKFRDTSPFIPAAIYQALTLVSDETAPALGLTPRDAAQVRIMRGRVLTLADRFQSPAWRSDRGSYGFWPRVSGIPDHDICWGLALAAQRVVRLDALWGDRAPINMCFWLPRTYITADADTTANVLAARIAAVELGEVRTTLPRGLERLFALWRDLGQEPMRVTHNWMSHPTGAFLTWLPVRAGITPQDVDLVVNANVLFFLGRYGRLDAPGVEEAIALINRGTLERRHHVISDVSQYYPDNLTYHYAIARAYDQGGVLALRPAVDVLVSELAEEALIDHNGLVHWDHGHPWLTTALAVSTLLAAGGAEELVEGGLAYLRETQHPLLGHWDAAPFFLGTTTSNVTGIWESRSWATAMAIEALMRARLVESVCD